MSAAVASERRENLGSRQNAIILIAAALMALGLVMVGSATSSLDQTMFAPRFWTTAFGRQACFVIVGLGLGIGVSRLAYVALDSETARAWFACLFYWIAVGLLILVLLPGMSDARHGSQRWLRFDAGGVAVGLQPSEVAKLALITFLAFRLGEGRGDPARFFRGFIPVAGAIVLCCGLVGTENFGTAALLVAVAFSMLLVGGCRIWHLGLMTVGAAAGLAILLFAEPYRMDRITAFMNLGGDAQGSGYQPLQSLTTIASGGWSGAGLGSGLQKYGYLPESHTDFIFAMLCEEMGFLGGVLVIALFCAFIWVGMRISLRAATPFEQLLGFGLTFLVGMQAIVNIAVVTVMAPTTGVPLPFLSAGGSGLLVACMIVGVMSAIAARGSIAAASRAVSYSGQASLVGVAQ